MTRLLPHEGRLWTLLKYVCWFWSLQICRSALSCRFLLLESEQIPSQSSQKGQKRVGNCLGIFFLSLGIFFWISGSHHFACYLRHFGAGNCHFHGMCNGFEFEPLIFHCIFHGICNSLQHVLSIFHALLSWNLHFHRMCNILQLHSSQYLQDFGAEG